MPDEADPAVAFFSTHMLEQAAGDAMMLSGLFGLCGLVLSLLAESSWSEPPPHAGRSKVEAKAMQ